MTQLSQRSPSRCAWSCLTMEGEFHGQPRGLSCDDGIFKSFPPSCFTSPTIHMLLTSTGYESLKAEKRIGPQGSQLCSYHEGLCCAAFSISAHQGQAGMHAWTSGGSPSAAVDWSLVPLSRVSGPMICQQEDERIWTSRRDELSIRYFSPAALCCWVWNLFCARQDIRIG